ncbi:MAG: radical SAM protein [Nanoarchaeota archaeon]|nr:radical SAM protein [Nanoarchaeota archaeon]
MKIILLYKPNETITNPLVTILPNGLRTIASFLKDCSLENLYNKNWDEIEELIKKSKPDIVGISCFTFNRHTVFKLASLVKKINPGTKVVLGGPFPTLMYNLILKKVKDIDYIVRGEGEVTFKELVDAIENSKPVASVEGIVFCSGKKIIVTPDRKPMADLDIVPISAKYPDRHIITSRGCPSACHFCSTPALWGRKVRFRSAKNVVDEIEMLVKRHKITTFTIEDDTFAVNKERVIDICKEIIKRELKVIWNCMSRVNIIDEERLHWMKKAGCYAVSYGVESGSERILKNINKNISLTEIKNAASLARKHGIFVNFFLMVGNPGETEETIKETIDMLKQTRPNMIITSHLQLYPGTKFYNDAVAKGQISDYIWFEDKESTPEATYFFHEMSKKDQMKYKKLIEEEFEKLDSDFSLKELNEILKMYPDDAYTYNRIGEIYYKQKRFEKAEEMYAKAIKINPGYARFHLALGLLHSKQRQFNLAISEFATVIDLDPFYRQAYINLGTIFGMAKKYEKAVKMFRYAVSLDRTQPQAYYNLGVIYGRIGDIAKMRQAFMQAVRYNHPKKRILLAQINKLTISGK